MRSTDTSRRSRASGIISVLITGETGVGKDLGPRRRARALLLQDRVQRHFDRPAQNRTQVRFEFFLLNRFQFGYLVRRKAPHLCVIGGSNRFAF